MLLRLGMSPYLARLSNCRQEISIAFLPDCLEIHYQSLSSIGRRPKTISGILRRCNDPAFIIACSS